MQFTDVLRRALDANVQYFTAVSGLAVECLETLLGSLTNLGSREQEGVPSATGEATTVPRPPAQQESSVPTILLEAVAGHPALGMFLVENVLSHPVSARIAVSTFVDPSGREVQPPIILEPEMITLEANEQVLVRVLAGIEESLAPAVDYRAEISIPDLPGTRVPLVLRRRATPKLAQSTTAKRDTASSKARAKVRGRNANVPRGRSSQKSRAR